MKKQFLSIKMTRVFGTATLVALLGVGLSSPVAAQQGPSKPTSREDLDDVAKSYEVFGTQQQGQGALQAELKALAAKRRSLQSEQSYVQAKIDYSKRKLEGRGATDGKESTYSQERDKWMREVKAWESRMAGIKDTLAQTVSEEKALMEALAKSVRSRTENDMVMPGETLEVYVAEDEAFNGLYQVRAGGYIVLPRMPKIFVAGKTLKAIETLIRTELGKTQLRNPTVTVDRVVGVPEVPAEAKETIYLAGEVRRPGPWPVPPNYSPTIVTLLLRVGLTYYADMKRVQVLRLVEGRGLIETVDVESIMAGEGLTSDFTLQADDIVIVPARETGEQDEDRNRIRKNRIHVFGNVVKPGIVDLVEPARMTVIAAIRHCGGPNRNADWKNLELIRIERDRTRREILDLGAIMSGQEPDVNLLSEDILVLYGVDKRDILVPLRVYLTGTVKKEGPVEIKGEEGELTLLQVILHNGGFASFADLSDVYVLRDMGNGIRNRIPVNLNKVKKGIIPDLIMKDNDVVVVPQRFFSF